MLRRRTTSSLITAVLLIVPCSLAYAEHFTDLPSTHPAFTAASDLSRRGIIAGYADGTFRPDRKVTRSEALKMIVAPLLAGTDVTQHHSSPYSDVPKGIWYLPYAEEARRASVIDGPPQKTAFHGERTVLTAEFVKMLAKANKVDLGFLHDAGDPFATDVQANDWHAPFMAYAIASSMIVPDTDWQLRPGQELTRADAAILLSNFLQYHEGERTQALLSTADAEMASVLQSFEAKNSRAALYAASIGLLAARGAQASRPAALTDGVVLLGQAFLALSKGNVAGSAGNYAQAVALAGQAWTNAGKAMQASPSLVPIGQKVRTIAHAMAESGRGNQ